MLIDRFNILCRPSAYVHVCLNDTASLFTVTADTSWSPSSSLYSVVHLFCCLWPRALCRAGWTSLQNWRGLQTDSSMGWDAPSLPLHYRQSWGGRDADCVYILVKSFRSAFTLNYDVINHHVTPSAGNVHGEILTSCTPGTMFHHKHITVGSFLVQRFLFNVSWVSRFSLISLVSEYEG